MYCTFLNVRPFKLSSLGKSMCLLFWRILTFVVVLTSTVISLKVSGFEANGTSKFNKYVYVYFISNPDVNGSDSRGLGHIKALGDNARKDSPSDLLNMPSLINRLTPLSMTRNLFGAGQEPKPIIHASIDQQDIDKPKLETDFVNSEQCLRWQASLDYLGSFEFSQQKWALIKQNKVRTLKIRQGSFIAELPLKVIEVNKQLLVFINENQTRCVFLKLK